MAVELFIQHNSTIQYPVVEEGAKLTLERKEITPFRKAR